MAASEPPFEGISFDALMPYGVSLKGGAISQPAAFDDVDFFEVLGKIGN